MPYRAAAPNCVPSHVGVLAMALASDIVLRDNTELLPRLRTALPIGKTPFTATIPIVSIVVPFWGYLLGSLI